MNLIKTIFTLVIVLASIFTTIAFSSINADAKKITQETSQIELAQKLPDGRKQLKKTLKLDYTHPNFETDIDSSRKKAILESLKKWKGDLPLNNTFTITSYADIKSDTQDENVKSKKINKSTPSSQIIYMWATFPNLNWNSSKPYNIEDYEEGDPRFVRKEFNMLLKQSKNGQWKGSVENSQEAKTESLEVYYTFEINPKTPFSR